jgi:hypothetical protein
MTRTTVRSSREEETIRKMIEATPHAQRTLNLAIQQARLKDIKST